MCATTGLPMKNVCHNWISYEKCAPQLESLRKPTLQTACRTWAPAGGEKKSTLQSTLVRAANPKKNLQVNRFCLVGCCWLVGCTHAEAPVGAKTYNPNAAGRRIRRKTYNPSRPGRKSEKKLTIQPVLLGCWLVALSTTHAEAPCGGKHVRYNWNPNEKCAVQLDFL